MKKVIILVFLLVGGLAYSSAKQSRHVMQDTLNESLKDLKWASEFNLLTTNSPSENTTALRNIFRENESGNLNTICIEKGVYNFDDSILPNGISDFKILAEKGVVLNITTDQPIIDSRLNSGGINNLYIENITFSSSYKGVTNENENPALFFVGATPIKNITFKEVNWTAPGGTINGFKSANESNYKTESVHFINNKWYDISRMAIELINHVDHAVSRYNDIKIEGGSVNNIGLAGTNGIGISFSGRGDYNSIKNVTFNNIPITAIENVGSWNTVYAENVFEKNVEVPILITNTYEKRQIKIIDNVDTEQAKEGSGMEFTNITGLTMSGNTFHTGIYFNNVRDVKVTNDVWISDVYGTVYVDGNSGDFQFKNVSIENNSEYNPAIITNGDSVENIEFINGFIKFNGPKSAHTGSGKSALHIENTKIKDGSKATIVENPK
ncbi:hypothetical protein [Aurantibacter sp.]|uniref:hypothetical protein n=1 Tax=Aurantibacter sp. TaxID=2807103 RepID=UPI003263F50C